jgi:hypothetical protein
MHLSKRRAFNWSRGFCSFVRDPATAENDQVLFYNSPAATAAKLPFIRLGANCEAIQDYILSPSPSCAGCWLWISEENLQMQKIEVFQTFEELARSLVRRVNKATRSTPAKRQRSKDSGSRNGRRSRARH